MSTTITRADQDLARLDVKLAERLGEPVDPRVKAIADMDRASLPVERSLPTSASTPPASSWESALHASLRDLPRHLSTVDFSAALEAATESFRRELSRYGRANQTGDTGEHSRDPYGSSIVTQDGQSVGRVSQVYLDDETGEPSWVSVQTARLAPEKVLLVPLAGSQLTDDGMVRVVHTKEAIETAPVVPADAHLGAEDVRLVLAHYGGTSDTAANPVTATSPSTKRPV